MKKTGIYRLARPLPTRASLALSVSLLALSLLLLAGLVYAQDGSISGTITYYGGLEPGTFHLNVDYTTDPNQPPGGGINLPGSGNYTLGGLPDDTYYVCVSIDPGGGGGPYTCYDPNGDGEPDPVEISGGGAVTGIDISLGGPWVPLGGPVVAGGQVNALAVHPAIADTVYAALAPENAYDSGPSTIYKSTDGAASWTPVYTSQQQVYAMAVTGTLVYAGVFNRGEENPSILASYDSGLNWAPIFTSTNRGVWLDISIHPTDTNVAIIGGWSYHGPDPQVQSGLVYRTDDAGLTWTPILTATVPGAEAGINAVMIHPVTPMLLLASMHTWGGPADQDSHVYRSIDGGMTWPISVTMPNAHVISMVANTTNPAMIYAGAGFGRFSDGRAAVFRSTDAGLSYDEVHSEGTYLAFEPPSTVYTVMDTGQNYVSTSNGDPGTWQEIGYAGDWVYRFDIDLGASPVNQYAGLWRDGVSKGTSDGGGWNWNLTNNGIQNLVNPVDIDVDPQNLDKMFVAAHSAGGWMSTDGGQTWTEPSGLAQYMFAFAINADDSNIVYAGASGCSGVQRSQDGGLSFETVYSPTHCLVGGGYENFLGLDIAQSRPTTVYAGGGDSPPGEDTHAAVVRSLDDSASWTEVFTLPPPSEVKALAIDPHDDDVVYVGGEDCNGPDCEGFVYRTTDGGDSWDLALVTTNTVESIVIDRWRSNVLYVADIGYWVHKSTDGGDSWTVVKPPWWVPPNDPSGDQLAIDPNVADHVYLGGWSYIAETIDGGETWTEWDDPLNMGTPEMEPGVLVADSGTVTQTLYAGFTGVWAYSRPALQPIRVYLPIVVKSHTP